MSFLKSIFGGAKPKEPHPNKAAVDTVQEFAGAIMQRCGEQAFAIDGLPKQVLCCYCFGAAHAIGQQQQLTTPDVHAITLTFLSQHMGYSIEASAAQAQMFIDATGAPNPNNTHKAIMHRGINGFLAWQSARETFDASDFQDVLRILQKPGIA